MIQIRKSDGSLMPVPADGHFVELINDADRTVQMVLMQPWPGVILQIPPGSKDAQRYEDMFRSVGVKFTQRSIAR